MSLSDFIELGRVEIAEQLTDRCTVRFMGREYSVTLGNECGYTAQARGPPIRQPEIRLEQAVRPEAGITLDRSVPREYWEAVILHEIREQEYASAGLEDAHTRATNDEVLYAIRYFPEDKRLQYLAFTDDYRDRHKPCSPCAPPPTCLEPPHPKLYFVSLLIRGVRRDLSVVFDTGLVDDFYGAMEVERELSAWLWRVWGERYRDAWEGRTGKVAASGLATGVFSEYADATPEPVTSYLASHFGAGDRSREHVVYVGRKRELLDAAARFDRTTAIDAGSNLFELGRRIMAIYAKEAL